MGARRWAAGVALAATLVAGGLAEAEPYEDGASSSAATWYGNSPRGGWQLASGGHRVRDIAQIGDRIYLAGSFQGIRYGTEGGVSHRSNLIAVDARSGEPIWSFDPQIDGTVFSLAVAPDERRLYAAGTFRNARGRDRRGLVALWPGGAVDRRWRADAVGGEVRAIVATNSFLYVGGDFDAVDGVARDRLARINRGSGNVDRSWNARADGGSVVTLEMPPARNRLYVGGHFDSLNGRDGTELLGALRTDTGGVDSGFRHEPGRDVIDLLADGRGRLWIGMDGGGGRAEVVDDDGDLIRRWDTEGDVSAVERIGSRVYLGGHEMGPGDREVATVDYDSPGSLDTSTFNPRIGGGEILAFHADGRQLWVGGFLSTGIRGFGRFSPR